MQEATKAHSKLALRPAEAAKALSISERLLWDWTHQGDIPHLRIGRTVLYPVHLVEEWLAKQSQSSNGGDL